MLTKLYLFLDDIFQPIPMRFGVCVVDYLFQSTLVQSQFDLVSRRRPFPFYCVWCLVMNNSWVNENTISSSSELNHLFIADSLQLTNLTSKFGRPESFATSISLEKLDRSVSSSCSYFLRQFSAILAASQPYFVDILFIRNNIKGGSKSFSLQSALFSSYKAF